MKGSKETRSEMNEEMLKEAVEKGQEMKQSILEMGGKIFKRGMMPKDAVGLSDNVVEGIYAQAYRLYNNGKYGEATYLFRMLILLNGTDPKYTLGLAACFHMLKEYKNALQTYAICGVLDPDNPIPHYHSSDCFIHLKDPLSAVISLELAVKRAGEKPQFKTLKDRALLSIESLKKEILSGQQGEKQE